MELYFTEQQTDFLRFGIRINETLYQARSDYQELIVVDTEPFGRLLALDGFVQLTERDEFIYHEMIAHVPMIQHPNPRRVLVIGGGDGGTVREVLRHPEVERVVLAEIDGQVIDVCRRFFPSTSRSLDDPRVEVCVCDGIEYVRNAEAGSFDVVLVDSSEPVGPGIQLFESPFYASVHRALSERGIMVAQTESPFYNADLIVQARRGIAASFAETKTYLAAVPTYPSGLWSFTMGIKQIVTETDEERAKHQQRMKALAGQVRYWTPEIQEAAFQLPRFLREGHSPDGRIPVGSTVEGEGHV